MPVRDTFWNIPQWAEVGQYILGFLAIIIFSYGVLRHVRRWRMGQPERRTDQLGNRLKILLAQTAAQFRISQDPFAGIMHLTIFWGMVALLVGTILATADWEITHLFFDSQFLTGGVYILYELILDIFGLLLIVGLIMAAYRRYIIRPQRLQNKSGRILAWDDAYAIVILFLVAITGYLVEGLRIAVIEPEWARWSPVGDALASLFVAMGDPTNRALHLTIWVSHALVAFLFIASIPYTKMFHLIAGPVNIFFRSLRPTGTLAPASESGEVGVKTWRDFTWKQILDFDACVRCGRCQDKCPAYASGLSLSPKHLMENLHTHVGHRGNGQNLYRGVVNPDELWACTTCCACVSVCPQFTDPVSTIVDMRRHLVIEGQVDVELQDALSNLGRYGNSFGKSPRVRARWTRSIQPKIKDARKEPVEYLWFVGDFAGYNAGLTAVTQMTAELFQLVGLDFGILFEGEHNAGNDVRRVGEEGLYEMLVEKNLKALNQCSFQAIVTTDPHTFNVLKNEYPRGVNSDVPVLHYSQLLDQLITSGKLTLTRQLNTTVTYHDPCYLGRYNGVYDAPRRVIEATGCKLVEMPRCREQALCCGAGGGRIWMAEGDVSERPSEMRIREAVELEGVSTLVVTCPKDVIMYRDAVKTTGNEDRLEIKDLIELVYETAVSREELHTLSL